MTTSTRIKIPHDELTYQIIGCAMAVHRNLGPGYREDTYQRDLEAQFTSEGIPHVAQKLLEVYDSAEGDVLIAYYVPDFIVDDSVVVEIKALKNLDDEHVAQVIGYLAVSRCPVGLLINFGTRSLQWRRILPPCSWLLASYSYEPENLILRTQSPSACYHKIAQQYH